MRRYRVRGVTERDEQEWQRYLRRDETVSKRISRWFRSPLGYVQFNTVAAIFVIVAFPMVIWLAPLLLATEWLQSRLALRTRLPMRMPMRARHIPAKPKWLFGGLARRLTTDWGDPKPGWSGYHAPRGLFFLGNAKEEGYELYLNANDILTHMLIFGTTGSGKTEALLGLSFNAIASGSGLIFVDPKGTNKLPLQVWSIARYLGRDDDFLLINYSIGNRKIDPVSPVRLSNTTNPFAQGASDFLSDILVSLAIPNEQGGNNQVFVDGAITLIKSLLVGLVEMRDQGRLSLNVRAIREWLDIHKCIELARDQQISDLARDAIAHFLKAVPGFNKKVLEPDTDPSRIKLDQKTLEQFGYNQFYFRRALSMLTDTYGHIYGSQIGGEVDFRDVVFSRRILVVILPSMEKAPQELQALGKVILSAVRAAVATGLGTVFEGTKTAMLDQLPSASAKPFLGIADEYGYVAVEGYAVTAAQARGLGFGAVFAGQDFAGFKRGSELEAEQVLANTKVKAVMALEDTEATWEVVRKLGGEADVFTSGERELRHDVTTHYADRGGSLTRRDRVSLQDLRQQIEGDAHIFFKDEIIRASFFHVPTDKWIQAGMIIHRMLELEAPFLQELNERFARYILAYDAITRFYDDGCDIQKLVAAFKQTSDDVKPATKSLKISADSDTYAEEDDKNIITPIYNESIAPSIKNDEEQLESIFNKMRSNLMGDVSDDTLGDEEGEDE